MRSGVSWSTRCLLLVGSMAGCNDELPAEASRDASSVQPSMDGGKKDPDAGGGVIPDAEPSDAELVSCGSGQCDLLDPLSCTAGEGCALIAVDGGATSQCIASGTGRDGDSCTNAGDCGPGLDCTALAAGGTCRRYCCELNRNVGCPSGQFCRIAFESSAGTLADAFLCDSCDGCDPSDSAACATGTACYALPGASVCTACLAAGVETPGALCQFATDCAPGSGCFRLAEAESRCAAYCRLDDSVPCSGEAPCRSVSGVTLPDGIGLCIP